MENIAKQAESLLADYSKMTEIDEKVTKARALVHCFDDFNELAKSVIKQQSRDLEIKEKYTDAIWNPFMANLMDEAVKKRITSAYFERLVPHLMLTISSNLNCTNASELHVLLDDSYKRLLILRNEETRKLERKLKREEDPSVILELLGVTTKETSRR